MVVLIHWMSFLLMSATAISASNCRNRLDVVIAVDTTSSQSSSSFDNVKAEVKGIVAGFTIGKSAIRLALISISKQAQLMVNFDAVNSVADFNTAVDALSFSTDTADLSEGLKAAKNYFSGIVTRNKASRVLVLVKDRRSTNAAVSDVDVLTRMTSEAAAIKRSGVAIHAVGVGGLWNLPELQALYGTDYLLFKSKSKAMESVKSMNNKVCEADCPRKGTSLEKTGPCIKSFMHKISTRVALAENSAGDSVCRTEIEREFASCSGTSAQKCYKVDRTISSCNANDKLSIEDSWQYFDSKQQNCATTKSVSTVACADANKCNGQIADVIFVLDRSGSIGNQFLQIINVTAELANSLNIGPDNVRVGVIKYWSTVETIIEIGSVLEKSEVMRLIRAMSNETGGGTATDLALETARKAFNSRGRPKVSKFVFVITDGASNDETATTEQTKLLKQDGVTLYAIGVGSIKMREMEMMAAPETSTNMFIFNGFEAMKQWGLEFSKRMCVQFTSPNPVLCANNVFIQEVSECVSGQQQIVRTEYNYDSAKKCIKTNNIRNSASCVSKCSDPIDGNEYVTGDKWTRLCHDFTCSSSLGLPSTMKCVAADGSCKDVNSAPFKCLDDLGVVTDNCRCVSKNGKTVLMIDRM